MPAKAKIVIFIVSPIKHQKKNFTTGIFKAPAANPAKSKKGLGMADRINMVSGPFFLIQRIRKSHVR